MRKVIEEIEYQSFLNLMDTQIAIKFVKDTFQKEMVKSLNLLRVTAPMFVFKQSGINDHLTGREEPVSFSVNGYEDDIEIVQSLAKWKRIALKEYGFEVETGLYTDMNAIRKDEIVDFIHSLYVDQWDWEKVISKDNRKLSYLKNTVRKIYKAIYDLSKKVEKQYPILKHNLPKKIYFISSSKLEKMFPNLSRKEREDEICRLYRAVFIYQIGWDLSDNLPHDKRAADYDDWNLNGDLLLYYDLYDMALEISSMGIRVDNNSLIKQLKHKGEIEKINNEYCQNIMNDALPYTIGGGIGQSRLCMFMLKKAHIGEVQVSLWSESQYKLMEKLGIKLL